MATNVKGDRRRILDRRRVREYLRTGNSLTRKKALYSLGISGDRLESIINDLRKRGARINKFKGDHGAWVYVAHERGLFENLEENRETES